jgi:hypothetical protein
MSTKVCTKCGIEKPIESYSMQRGGRRPMCKPCSSEYNRQRLDNNPELKKKFHEMVKQRRENMTEEQRYMENLKKRARKRKVSLDVILEEELIYNEAQSQGKKYCYDCKLILDKSCFGKLTIAKDGLNTSCINCRKNARSKFYYENSAEIYERKKEYIKNNRRKILDRQKKYVKKRKEEDPIFKLTMTLRNRIKNFMKCKGISKKINKKTIEMVGCGPTELKEHIEKQFMDGMSWENHGPKGWHLDHIIPLISAKTEEDMFKLNHYTNLQPLWAKDNLKKGKKIV